MHFCKFDFLLPSFYFCIEYNICNADQKRSITNKFKIQTTKFHILNKTRSYEFYNHEQTIILTRCRK